MTVFGQRIKEQRLEKALTTEEVAKDFHTTRQTISRWESGVPGLDIVVRFAEYFKVTND